MEYRIKKGDVKIPIVEFNRVETDFKKREEVLRKKESDFEHTRMLLDSGYIKHIKCQSIKMTESKFRNMSIWELIKWRLTT